ncbi:MAG: Lrp/AsnC family transcriptional regulator [Candidatus Zixiibacteriota bacterium]
MKPGAYLLINVKSGTELMVHNDLMQKDFVYHSRVVTGLHDIICYVEDDNIELLKDHIYNIRKTEGVTRTVTCFAFNSDSGQ